MSRTAHPLVRPRRPRHPSTIRLPPPSRPARLLHTTHRRRRSKPLPVAPAALRRRVEMQLDYGEFHSPFAALRDFLLFSQLSVLPRPAELGPLQRVSAS
jgi:hypothetical protein